MLPADHVIRDAQAFQRRRARSAAPRPRRASSSRSASCPTVPRRATATSSRGAGAGPVYPVAAVRREARGCGGRGAYVSVRASSTGTAACSCSAPASYLDELAPHAPAMLERVPARACAGAQQRSRLHAPADARRSQRLSERLDRLRRHGEDRTPASSCRSMPAGATSARGRRCSDALPRDAARQRHSRAT